MDGDSFHLLIERIFSFAMPCARCQVYVPEPWWKLEWTLTVSGWRFYCFGCKQAMVGERCLTSRPVYFFEGDVNWKCTFPPMAIDGGAIVRNRCIFGSPVFRGLDICVQSPTVVGGTIHME